MTMIVAVGMPTVMLMLMLTAMVVLMLLGHSFGDCHSTLTCGNANGNGDGCAIAPQVILREGSAPHGPKERHVFGGIYIYMYIHIFFADPTKIR